MGKRISSKKLKRDIFYPKKTTLKRILKWKRKEERRKKDFPE